MGGSINGGGTTATAELYDPTAGTFAATGSMAAQRHEFGRAILLNTGKVLVAGGEFKNGAVYDKLSSAELYDPAAGTFAATGGMATARTRHTMTLLSNGKVLVVGGENGGGILAGAEIYDPALGTFSLTGSLSVPRHSHTAVLLPNGTVLIAGGQTPAAWFVNSSEIYDPTSGTFTPAAPMGETRRWDDGWLLPNGKVLLKSHSVLDTAELYVP
jgi:hypothetical protein